MGNQLQRFIDRGVGDAEDKEKINKIKELLIKMVVTGLHYL